MSKKEEMKNPLDGLSDLIEAERTRSSVLHAQMKESLDGLQRELDENIKRMELEQIKQENARLEQWLSSEKEFQEYCEEAKALGLDILTVIGLMRKAHYGFMWVTDDGKFHVSVTIGNRPFKTYEVKFETKDRSRTFHVPTEVMESIG